MKAVQLLRFGGPEVLEIKEVPTPQPGPGEALIRVHASGVNFADTLIRQDRYATTPTLPSILGNEVAGSVAALGTGVVGLEIGARVAAPLFATAANCGGYAEFVAINADLLIPLPTALSFDAAASLMVQGLTAIHLVRQTKPLHKTIQINAAAGGVGSMLIQLARRAGATTIVAAASTDEKLAMARALGADVIVNYTDGDWPERLKRSLDGKGPDLIFESAGGSITAACLRVLAPLGQIVVYGALNIQQFEMGVPDLLSLIFNNQSLTGFAFGPLLNPVKMRADLIELFDIAAAGEVKVTVGGRYTLEQASEAHRDLERRKSMGKLLLTI